MAKSTTQMVQEARLDIQNIGEFSNSKDPNKTIIMREGRPSSTLIGYVMQMLDNGGYRGFANETELKAYRPSSPNSIAKDLSTAKVWLWDGTAWSDTGLSELDRAKDYTDQNKLDFKEIEYSYENGNSVGPNTAHFDNKGVDAALNISNQYQYKSKSIPVAAGDILYLFNSVQNYLARDGFGHAFFSKSFTEATNADRVAASYQPYTHENGTKYIKVVVPKNVKYLVFNTQFNSTVIDWAIHKNEFNSDYKSGTEVVSKIQKSSFNTDVSVISDVNLFNKDVDYIQPYYVANTLTPVVQNGQPTWKMAVIQIKPDQKKYFMIMSAENKYPFHMAVSKTDALTIRATRGNWGVLARPTWTLIDKEKNLYEVVIPDNFEAQSLLASIYIVSDGGFSLDVVDSFAIYEDLTYSEYKQSVQAVEKIDNCYLIDREARNRIALLSKQTHINTLISNVLFEKNVYTFGDSITQGTMGGYQQYLAKNLGCNVSNYGSSGANTNRLYGIMLGKKSRNHYDGDVAYTAKDYTKADTVTIMIGTNDFNYGDAYWNSIADLPKDNVYEHVEAGTTDAYFESFKANFAGNVGACIEYVKWKNPKCKIYLT